MMYVNPFAFLGVAMCMLVIGFVIGRGNKNGN